MYTKGLQSNQVMRTSQDYINETDYFNILNPLVISKMHDCLNVSKSDVKLIFLNIKRISQYSWNDEWVLYSNNQFITAFLKRLASSNI